MKETLLIILLIVAIISDAIRIMQYRRMTSGSREKDIRRFAVKFWKLLIKKRGFYDGIGEREKYMEYADYCVEHWDDVDL